jgi:hypothetical protein
MKNKKLILLTVSTFAGLFAFSFSTNAVAFLTVAEETDTTLTLDSSNKPVAGDDGHSLVLADYLTLNYTGASLADGHHVVLEQGGTIKRNEASKDLKYINATFTGDLEITTYYTEGEPVMRFNLTSGTTHEIVGNYWTIQAMEESVLTNVTFTFGCEFDAIAPSSETATITGLTNVTQVKERDGATYYVLEGNSNLADGLLNKENIYIFEGNYTDEAIADYELYPEYVVYTSKSTFAAYFNLNSFEVPELSAGTMFQFYVHLYVQGQPYGGGNGDVLSSTAFESSDSYDIGNDNFAFLDEFTYSSGKKHMVRLNFVKTSQSIVSTIGNGKLETFNYWSQTKVASHDANANAETPTNDTLFNIELFSMKHAELKAEDFVLKANDDLYPITASDVHYESFDNLVNKVTVTFDMKDLLDDFMLGRQKAANTPNVTSVTKRVIDWTNKKFQYYTHLFIKGVAWDPTTSDVRLSNTANGNAAAQTLLWTIDETTYDVDVLMQYTYDMFYFSFGLSQRISNTTPNNARLEVVDNTPMFILNVGLGGQPMAAVYSIFDKGDNVHTVKTVDLGDGTVDLYFDLRDMHKRTTDAGEVTNTFYPHIVVNGLYSGNGDLKCPFTGDTSITFDGVTYTQFYKWEMPNVAFSA